MDVIGWPRIVIKRTLSPPNKNEKSSRVARPAIGRCAVALKRTRIRILILEQIQTGVMAASGPCRPLFSPLTLHVASYRRRPPALHRLMLGTA